MNCDGYEVTLVLQRVSQFKNAIVVYVNGKVKVEWLFDDCEERRRFFRPIAKPLYTKKFRDSFKKTSKRQLKKTGLDLAKKYIYYDYKWMSFKALKRHFQKNNEVIELVKEVVQAGEKEDVKK